MSDRLAISASFSILMMAIYVLFGADVERMPLGQLRIHALSESSGSPLFARD